MAVMRLDKYLTEMGIGSRSEVKNYAKAGRVSVNGEKIKSTDTKIDTQKDTIEFDGQTVGYVEYEYYMLNKPQGVLSATMDKKATTVVDLIDSKVRGDLFPVGRLDKDTEGLLIITNDGVLCHNLLSPKKHVDKVYYAIVDGEVKEEHIEIFKNGIRLDEDTVTKPAELKIIASGEESEVFITIHEGKFHQVKRMVNAIGGEVMYLKRLSMGSLKLDENLKPGEYRKLTGEELDALKQ